jgi:hypothetical protein
MIGFRRTDRHAILAGRASLRVMCTADMPKDEGASGLLCGQHFPADEP